MGRGRATGLLRLLGRRRDAGPDGPDGLVGDDDPRLIFETLEDWDEVDELRGEDRQHGTDALLCMLQKAWSRPKLLLKLSEAKKMIARGHAQNRTCSVAFVLP